MASTVSTLEFTYTQVLHTPECVSSSTIEGSVSFNTRDLGMLERFVEEKRIANIRSSRHGYLGVTTMS